MKISNIKKNCNKKTNKMSFSTFKFGTVGENSGTPWRTFNGQIGARYTNFMVGVNLKDEIEKEWGSVDTANYVYTFGFMIKRIRPGKDVNGNSITAGMGHIIGCGTLNPNSYANLPKTFGAGGYGYYFTKENQGIFNASSCFKEATTPGAAGDLISSGCMQSSSYQGGWNTFTGTFYGFDFANINGYWPTQGWGNYLDQIGNPASIVKSSETDPNNIIITNEDLSGVTTYFWITFDNAPQTIYQIPGHEYGRVDPTRVCFFGKSRSYPNQIYKELYPSFILQNNNGVPNPSAIIIPAAFSPPVAIQAYPGPNNFYFVSGDYTFDDITTVLIRTKIDVTSRETLWFARDRFFAPPGTQILGTKTGPLDSSQWGEWLNSGWMDTNSFNLQNYTTKGYTLEWSWYYFNMCRYPSYIEYKRDVNRGIDGMQGSMIWNDEFSFDWSQDAVNSGEAEERGYNPWEFFKGVKGIGEVMFVSSTDAAKCLNLNICGQTTNTLEDCNTELNASECVTQVETAPNFPGYLGWDAANVEEAFCVREPEDEICGCVNTINNENIAEFIQVFEQATGLDLPNYCFSKACTDPTLNAWIDPRIDFNETCPDNLTFCISLIDIAGNNNTIKDTDIYQDCSQLVGDQGGGGSKSSTTTTTFIIIGVVIAIIVIIFLIIFLVRRKPPTPQ